MTSQKVGKSLLPDEGLRLTEHQPLTWHWPVGWGASLPVLFIAMTRQANGRVCHSSIHGWEESLFLPMPMDRVELFSCWQIGQSFNGPNLTSVSVPLSFCPSLLWVGKSVPWFYQGGRCSPSQCCLPAPTSFLSWVLNVACAWKASSPFLIFGTGDFSVIVRSGFHLK